MLDFLERLTPWLGDRLLAGSIEGAIVIAIVWLLCRTLRRVPPSLQAALWWLASLKLLTALAGIPAVPLPLLPPDAQAPADRVVVTPELVHADWASTHESAETFSVPVSDATPGAATLAPPLTSRAPKWLTGLMALWFAGLLVQAFRLGATLRAVRGIVLRSGPHDDDAAVGAMAAAVGLSRIPDVRVSAEIDAPQVVGVLRPTVLLPRIGVLSLTMHQRDLALAHELMHVRRRDLLIGWIPALA